MGGPPPPPLPPQQVRSDTEETDVHEIPPGTVTITNPIIHYMYLGDHFVVGTWREDSTDIAAELCGTH